MLSISYTAQGSPNKKTILPKCQQCRAVLDHGRYDETDLGNLAHFIPNAQQKAWHIGVTQSLLDGWEKDEDIEP